MGITGLGVNMSLENFRVPKTPETRIPHVLLVLLVIETVALAVRWFIGSRFSVELFVVITAAAIVYVIWRYLRQQAD